MRRGRWAICAAASLTALAAAVALPGGARAQLGGGPCLTANPPAIDAPAQRLRFGIAPLSAGSAGASQAQPKPENPAAALAELRRLRPEHRQLILRLNRMSMADGEAGIHRYASLVDDYARAGFDTELQVRYHPGPGQEGDMAAWTRYVRDAVSVLGKRPTVKALTITNEGNFPVSPNTSDGSFSGVKQAIVSGTIAARERLDRMGRPDVQLGFSFAWRWLPSSDAAFWQEIGSLGNARFRKAVDYVGLQIYPGLVYPPVLPPGRSAGDEITEALSLLRGCYMPMAGLGPRVQLWVTENGYPTNLGHGEAEQVGSLSSTLDQIHRYSGTLGVTDYRWFNLRDNDSSGSGLFDAVGLLRDDYSEKPAFATLRSAIKSIGTARPRTRRCGGRVATIVGTAGGDHVRGSRGPDVIWTGGGADRVKAGRGRDLICTGSGADRIRAGAGADRIWAGPGEDRCLGGRGRNHLHGCER